MQREWGKWDEEGLERKGGGEKWGREKGINRGKGRMRGKRGRRGEGTEHGRKRGAGGGRYLTNVAETLSLLDVIRSGATRYGVNFSPQFLGADIWLGT